jgi:hypothetical protein
MNKAESMPIVLVRRVEDLRKAGYRVTFKSNADGLLVLDIKKAGTDEEPKHYIFYY